MKKVFLYVVLLVILASLVFASCASPAPAPQPSPTPTPTPAPAPAPIELKLGHNSSTQSGSHIGFMEPWARQVEKATNNRVKITIYPTETLFKAKDAIVAVEQGIADIGWVLVGFFPGRYPLGDIISLPFLNLPGGTVDGRKLSASAINSHIFMELFEKFPEMQKEWTGVKPLILHTAGPTYLWTNKQISKIDQIKGLKVRSFSGPDGDMWQALGAAPIPMPLPQVYEAAEKKVLDGCNVDWGGISSYRLYEVLQYKVNQSITLSRYALVMNQAKWNSLPPDIQKIITDNCGVRGAEFAGNGMEKGAGASMEEDVRAAAIKNGKPLVETNFSPEDVAKWKALAKPLYDKYLAELKAKGLSGEPILNEALNLIDKYK
jgi:TRAP-type C4-dicarboxylate transport system substrate-binding protein